MIQIPSARPGPGPSGAAPSRSALSRLATSWAPRPRKAAMALLLLPALLSACGSKEDDVEELGPVPPVEILYNNGLDALTARRFVSATNQFQAVEQNYPYSPWAVNAQLMQAYALYVQTRYTDALGTLDRFIQLHPAHRDIAYAYYLRALCYYEQIADVQRDQRGTEQAISALQDVINRFPETAYARDARLKIDLGRDHLAGKEMEVGRWYQAQHQYQAAIGRFQRVVDDYQTTNHAAEALHRLTEIYLVLGLKDQARKTAAVLGYNYPGSEWYQDSYSQLVDDGMIATPEQRGRTQNWFSRTWRSLF